MIQLFECEQCSTRAENIALFADQPEHVGCACGGVMIRRFSAPGFRMQGATIMDDSPYQWDDTALEGKSMRNPMLEKSGRKSGEIQPKITVDGGHHIQHGTRRGTRTILEQGG